MTTMDKVINETTTALEVLDTSFNLFATNQRFPDDLKNLIDKYLPIYDKIPDSTLLPHIFPFADVDVMKNSIEDIVNTGLFHYVIYKNLLNDFFGGKKK